MNGDYGPGEWTPPREKIPWWEEWQNWFKSWLPKQEEEMAPSVAQPEYGKELDPDTYLRMLQNVLNQKLYKGDITDKDVETWGQRAADMLSQGYFGPDLPYFTDVYGDYVDWYEREQERFAVEGPEPVYSENIETVGDYDAIVRRDESGRIVDIQTIRYAGGATPTTARAPTADYEPYEQYRQRMLSELTGPRDWITRWKLQHMPTRGREEGDWGPTEKLGPRYISREKRYAGLSGQEAAQQGLDLMKSWIDVREMTLGRPLTREEGAERVQEFFESQMPPLRRDEEQGPTEPPAPSWLPQFVPGLTAGQPIKKLPTKTPSGQQWGMTPWSVREGLAGYTDYAQYRPYQDILEHMAMMAPRTPVSAGRTRWTPARQRA